MNECSGPGWRDTLALLAIKGGTSVPDALEAELPGCQPPRRTADLFPKIRAQERIFVCCAGNLVLGQIQRACLW